MRGLSLLFDLDGTIINPYEGVSRCIQHALQKLDIPCDPAERLDWAIGPPLHLSFGRILGPERGHLVAEAVAHYRDRYGVTGMYEHTLYAGIEEALRALASRHDLYVATSKPRVFAVKILEHFGLSPFFRAIGGSELDGRNSDKGELIAHVLSANAIDRSRAVMIGDRSYDAVGAGKNGIPCVGVTWGYGSEEELSQAGAAALAGHPADLAALFERWETPAGPTSP